TLNKKFIELPIITLGGDGAIAYIDNKFYRFRSPNVSVKNAVGSGDSTVAGIAAGISRGLSLSEAVVLGMAAGTANTQFDETGYVSRELVDEYFGRIKYELI
ncbi:MAG: bifunctional hydroxymethylpyrimidine kinase/phosphomethylpyrimidine kinase, partial [Clostridia bacterium]|nr:bifunctional hydroxymethylpyrimidine kinase/phosphomethylpyrimidine kinase [Clostridia bacterium]